MSEGFRETEEETNHQDIHERAHTPGYENRAEVNWISRRRRSYWRSLSPLVKTRASG
jgi:hypothetical protein